MADPEARSTAESTTIDGVSAGLTRMGGHPGLIIAAGVLGFVIGVLVLVWPAPSTVVLAWLFAIQMCLSGVLQLVAAFAGDGSGAERALFALLGALLIVIGLLCLRAPLQTAVVLGLLIGASWVVSGIIGIVAAIGARRGWGIASGLVSVIGGAAVLVYPGTSVVVLTWLFGVVLVLIGIFVVIEGFAARRRAGREPVVVAATA